MCLGISFSLAIQHIHAIPHRLLGTISPQMLLTPSENSYSSFVRFPQGVFFLLFNQGLDTMLRGLFSCETRPCRPRLTIHIIKRLSYSLTNELSSHTERIGNWIWTQGQKWEGEIMFDRQTPPQTKWNSFNFNNTLVVLCATATVRTLICTHGATKCSKIFKFQFTRALLYRYGVL